MKKDSKPSKVKLTLAALGAVFLVAGIALGVYKAVYGSSHAGPSSLTLHPENQEQLLSERRANEFAGKLDLTPDQTTQVTELVKQFRAEGREMRKQRAGEDPRNLIAQRMAGMQDFDTKMQALLTPEQREKYDAMQNERQGRIGQALALRQRFVGADQ